MGCLYSTPLDGGRGKTVRSAQLKKKQKYRADGTRIVKMSKRERTPCPSLTMAPEFSAGTFERLSYLYIAKPPQAVGCVVTLGVGQLALPG